MKLNVLTVSAPSSEQSSPKKCSVDQYVALQTSIAALDIIAMVQSAATPSEVRDLVHAALNDAWTNTACYKCEETRATALFPAVKTTNGECHNSFDSSECLALLASVNSDWEVCMKDAVDGVIPTTSTTTNQSGTESLMSTIAVVAYIAAGLAAN